MTTPRGNKKNRRVSFACCLVNAVWTTSSNSNSGGGGGGGGESTGVHGESLFDSLDALMFSHSDSVHHTVDSLRLELELPFVSRYRVVEYLWQQCYRITEDDGVTLPCRPSNVVRSVMDDAHCRTSNGDISSTSLQVMDGFGLQCLTTLPEEAFVLHPYSRHLDLVTRPVLAFLRRISTLQLSQRQNNLIGLLPKLMEIIILLCHRLERAAMLRDEGANHHLRRHDVGSCDSLLSDSPVCAASQNESHCVKVPGWTLRCAWWLSRFQGRATLRPHRLFTHVKELLLRPGPLCAVKADYLQHIAHRFFPGLLPIQRTPAVLLDSDDTANGEVRSNVSTHDNADSMRLAKEPAKNRPAVSKGRGWWRWRNG